MERHPGSRSRWIALAVFGLFAGALMVFAWQWDAMRQSMSQRVISTGEAAIAARFTLTDHTGRRVTEKDFSGRHLLVFFGFTSCPDVCPTALLTVTQALERLGTEASGLSTLFITVDPERDSPQQVAAYLESFHPSIVGLTGTPDEIAAAEKSFRVYARKVPSSDGSGDYTMDHSALLYLMGPDGAYLAHFPPTIEAEALASALAARL
jgi:protein SCO1/2